MFSLFEYEMVFGAIIVVLLGAGAVAAWRRENHETEQKETLVSLSPDRRVFLASEQAEKAGKALRAKAEARITRKQVRLQVEAKMNPRQGKVKSTSERARDASRL